MIVVAHVPHAGAVAAVSAEPVYGHGRHRRRPAPLGGLAAVQLGVTRHWQSLGHPPLVVTGSPRHWPNRHPCRPTSGGRRSRRAAVGSDAVTGWAALSLAVISGGAALYNERAMSIDWTHCMAAGKPSSMGPLSHRAPSFLMSPPLPAATTTTTAVVTVTTTTSATVTAGAGGVTGVCRPTCAAEPGPPAGRVPSVRQAHTSASRLTGHAQLFASGH